MSKELAKKRLVEVFEKVTDLWRQGVESIYQGCIIFVKEIDEHPDEADELCELFIRAGMSRYRLNQFIRVGREKVDPRLLSPNCGPHAKRISRLDKVWQKRVLDGESFEFMNEDGQIRMVCAVNCMDFEAKQLFDGGHIRTLPEQKAFIEKQKRSIQKDEKFEPMPYEIKGKYAYIRNGRFTAKQLLQIAEQLTK